MYPRTLQPRRLPAGMSGFFATRALVADILRLTNQFSAVNISHSLAHASNEPPTSVPPVSMIDPKAYRHALSSHCCVEAYQSVPMASLSAMCKLYVAQVLRCLPLTPRLRCTMLHREFITMRQTRVMARGCSLLSFGSRLLIPESSVWPLQLSLFPSAATLFSRFCGRRGRLICSNYAF